MSGDHWTAEGILRDERETGNVSPTPGLVRFDDEPDPVVIALRNREQAPS